MNRPLYRITGIPFFLFLVFLGVFSFFSCSRVKKNSLADGTYSYDVAVEGGTGKAKILSPVEVKVEAGKTTVTLLWNSRNYDYMVVGGKKYLNQTPDGKSSFVVEIDDIENPVKVLADTTAMSVPHEIEYTLCFSQSEPEFDGTLELAYARQFSVDLYGDFKVIRIEGEGELLLVPQGRRVPGKLSKGRTVLVQPLDRTYMVSTSAMDLVLKAGSIDFIKFCSLKENDWFIDEISQKVRDGSMTYAGKYGSPDFEMLVSKKCNLAVQNTMIHHKPHVKDKLAELGIPVVIEKSNFEEDVMGRLEWVKFYGLLFGNYEASKNYFDRQVEKLGAIKFDSTGTDGVAFFSVNSNGIVNIRKKDDHVVKMIAMAGGQYVPLVENSDDKRATGTMNIQMEEFFLKAKDADILVYNGTIDSGLDSIDALVAKSQLFNDFKAVREGRVYTTDKNFFQQVSGTADFISDLNRAMKGQDDGLTFMKKLERK